MSKYFHFYTRQKKNNNEKRELDITIEADNIKEAYRVWNKRMKEHNKEGWTVIGNYCGQ